MLKIRRVQLQAFDQLLLQQFEDDMVVHLREFSPVHARGIREDALRTMIRNGIHRARSYGFTLRGSVRFYIEMMVQYGSDFDTDPILPWASTRLRNDLEGPELERADRLHAAAMDYRDAVIGKDYEVEIAAIRRLLRKSATAWLAGDLSEREVETRLWHIHPAKCERAGSPGLMSIVAKGRDAAREQGLPADAGGTVMTALMFGVGHGVWADPQYRWVSETLAETRQQSPSVQIERLATKAMAYFRAGLSILEGQ